MDDATNSPASALLTNAFERLRDGVPEVVEGLSIDDLLWRPEPVANHVAWLLWHLSRQHDAQVAALADDEPVWTEEGWADRFALPYPPEAHGYDMTSVEVRAFTVADPLLFGAYQAAVHKRTVRYLGGLDPAAYDRVVDERWDPPVTVATRLVSVLVDGAKHLGQAEYLKGLLRSRRS